MNTVSGTVCHIPTHTAGTVVFHGNTFSSIPTPPQRNRTADAVFDFLERRGVISYDMTEGEFLRAFGKLLWGVFLTFLMIAETASGKIGQSLAVFGQITPLMLLQNLGIIVLVVLAWAALAQIPGMGFTWLMIFDRESEGANINVAPASIPWLGILFSALLFINLPTFVLIEERMFRMGVVEWPDAIKWALIFGLVHCLVGVPLAVGFALTIGGLWFQYQCFEGGVTLSTIHHTAYNAILVGLGLLIAVAKLFVKPDTETDPVAG